jgi:predicted porin
MASGFLASGLGSTFEGAAYLSGSIFGDGVDELGNARSSQGFIVQGMYTLPNGKLGLGVSYGQNKLKLTDEEEALPGGGVGQFASRSSWVGQVTYHWTKSLRVVGEYTYFDGKQYDGIDGDSSTKTSKGNQFALGMMLFY